MSSMSAVILYNPLNIIHVELPNLFYPRSHDYIFYIPWPFPPVWGVADNTKETTKTMGISLHSSSNDEGPSRVWMADS